MSDIDDDFEPIDADQLDSLLPRRSQQDYLREREIREIALKSDLFLVDWIEVTGAAPDEDIHNLFVISEQGVSYQPLGEYAQRIADPEVREFHARRASQWNLSFPCTATTLLAFIDSTESSFSAHPKFRSAVGYLTESTMRPRQLAPAAEGGSHGSLRVAQREDALAREIADARQSLSMTSKNISASAIWSGLKERVGKGAIREVTSTVVVWQRDDGDLDRTTWEAFQARIRRSNKAAH